MRSFRVALVGEVDAGKSSTLGQILLKTKALPDQKIQEAQRASEAQNKDFEPAFLLDAFESERVGEMTLDITSVVCRHGDLLLQFLDTPGHQELSHKFIGGAARADLALLVIDCSQKVEAQQFRHLQQLAVLGLKDVGIILNKWELRLDSDLDHYQDLIRRYLVDAKIKIHFFSSVTAKTGEGFQALLRELSAALRSLPIAEENSYLCQKQPFGQDHYWIVNQGSHYHQPEELFGRFGPVKVGDVAALGAGVFDVRILGQDPGPLLVEQEHQILSTHQFNAQVLWLEDKTYEITTLRFAWQEVRVREISQVGPIEFGIYGDLLTLQTFDECFFWPKNSRENIFALESHNRLVAVGIFNTSGADF